MPVPQSITRWFASQYPAVQLSPQWLEECYAYLNENFTLTAPALLKKVENQLLLSDLNVSTVQHERLFPANEQQTDILFQDVKGQGVLVQVLEILEIGRPALELLKLHREKIEDKKVFREQGRTVFRAVNEVEATQQQQDGQLDNTNGGNNDMATIANNKNFPHAMLRLRLSDGFTEYTAIETRKVKDLDLDETPLGSKLFLKNIRCLRGVLMLDDTTCIVKGGFIPDLDERRDELLEALLVARVNGDDAVENNPQPVYQQPPPNVNNGVQPPARAANVPSNARPAPPAQSRPVSSSRQDTKPAVGTSKPVASTKATTSTASSARANGASTAAASSKRTMEDTKPKVKKQDYDEDAFDDDDDDVFDEEALLILQEAESKRIKSSNSATSSGSSNAHPPGRRAAPSVQPKLETLARHDVPAASQSTSKPGNTAHIHHRDSTAPRASTSRPHVEVRLQSSNIIDLDDSSDVDELKDELDDDNDEAAEEAYIASLLISDSSQGDPVVPLQRNGRAGSAARGRTNAPIEID